MGIIKTAAKVAVASSVHGRVQRRQQRRWAAQDAAAGAAASPPAAPVAPQQSLTTIEQLKMLGELRDGGVLSDAEFEQQKARLLAGG